MIGRRYHTSSKRCPDVEKKAEQALAAIRDLAAVAHLDLPELVGSDRQIAWAMTIRASRLAAIITDSAQGNSDQVSACLPITDAKWWIDHRDLAASEFGEKVMLQTAAMLNARANNSDVPQAA